MKLFILALTLALTTTAWAVPKTYPVESPWVNVVGYQGNYHFIAHGEVQMTSFIRRSVTADVEQLQVYGKVSKSAVQIGSGGKINCAPAYCEFRNLSFDGRTLSGVFYADLDKDGRFETVSGGSVRICDLKPDQTPGDTDLWLQNLKMFYTLDRETEEEILEVQITK